MVGKFSSGMPETGDDWFKFLEGQNRLRIVSDGAVMAEHFIQGGGGGICYGKEQGCSGCAKGIDPTYRKLFWVIDRKKVKDAEGNEKEAGFKLAKFGSVVIKQLDALADNPDYSFDEFPMPYDVTIDAKGAGDKGVKYTVMPSPKLVPLTAEEIGQMNKNHSVSAIVASMKRKRAQQEGSVYESKELSSVDYPEEDIDTKDMSF